MRNGENGRRALRAGRRQRGGGQEQGEVARRAEMAEEESGGKGVEEVGRQIQAAVVAMRQGWR